MEVLQAPAMGELHFDPGETHATHSNLKSVSLNYLNAPLTDLLVNNTNFGSVPCISRVFSDSLGMYQQIRDIRKGRGNANNTETER